MSRARTLASHLDHGVYVRVERRGDVGLLIMRHRAPRPATEAALTSPMRAALMQGLRALESDTTTRVIVLTSDSCRVFSSGVNQEDFRDGMRSDAAAQVPSLAELCEAVETARKVVVALIMGCCQSWGLELAMAAPYRVAAVNARFSFPEVELSLVPCGGGSQRLSRLVGVRQALVMLCTGKSVHAEEARRMGLVDVVAEATGPGARSVQERAFEYALAFAARAKQFKPFVAKGRRDGRVGLYSANAVHLAWMEHKIREYAPRHVRAPYACLKVVRIAAQHSNDFSLGVSQEGQEFQRCLEEPQCVAMQHVLESSDRVLSRWEAECRTGTPLSGTLRGLARPLPAAANLHQPFAHAMAHSLPFRHAAVVGAGTIGVSIAFLLLQHGLHVTVVELDAARQLAVTRQLQQAVLAAANVSHRVSLEEAQEALRRLAVVGSHYTPYPSELAAADLVIECVPESLNVKKNVFAHLDRICHRNCVLATGSACVDVTTLAKVTGRAQKVVGVQLCPPANVSMLAEVSCGAETDSATLRSVLALMDKLQKHVIVSRSAVGHVSSRLLLAALYQAYALLEEGCFPVEVDKALKGKFQFKMGLFEMEDVIGVDAVAMARQQFFDHESNARGDAEESSPVSPLMPRPVYSVANVLVQRGLVGRKSGEGWYRYKETVAADSAQGNEDDAVPMPLPSLANSWNPYSWRSGRMLPRGQWQAQLSVSAVTPVRSREVEYSVLRVCKAKGIMRRDVSDGEIVERVLLAMINEAAKLLGGGVALCAADIDCASVHAHGFPAWKGGLLFYADHELGVEHVIKRMEIYRTSAGKDAFPAPCAALRDLRQRHLSFARAYPAVATTASAV